MTRVEIIQQFAEQVIGEKVIIQQQDDWGMNIAYSKPHLCIPANLDYELNELDIMFRDNFISRCPLAIDFADVTLSILHEIGHHFHREEYIFMNLKKYNSAYGLDHLNLECEIVATNWAIEWLQDPEHRKMAKQFEREFFSHA